MSDEIEWSQIIDGIDLSVYCSVGRYMLKKKKKEMKDRMIAFWSLGIIHIYLLVRCWMYVFSVSEL